MLSYKAQFFACAHNAMWTTEIGYCVQRTEEDSTDLILCEQGSTQLAFAQLFHLTEKSAMNLT